jgi:L-threonylcarbamoyladenylate synthase
MPDHRIPLELVKRSGTPLAAPSANLSGKPSPSLAAHVLADLAGRIDAVIDGGGTAIGLESTVVDMTVEPPVVLRPGAVGIDELERVIGKVRPAYGEAEDRTVEAMPEKRADQKYNHYAPDTQVVLVEGERKKVSEKIGTLLENYLLEGEKVGLLLSNETAGFFASERLSAHECFLLGSREEPEEAARRLFEGLRDLDAKGLDIILADGSFSLSGLGTALLNRLREAASVRHVV